MKAVARKWSRQSQLRTWKTTSKMKKECVFASVLSVSINGSRLSQNTGAAMEVPYTSLRKSQLLDLVWEARNSLVSGALGLHGPKKV